MLDSLARLFIPEIDAEMQRVVDSHPGQPDDLQIMIRYAMGWVNESGVPTAHATGKRIRPMLVLMCAQACGGDWHSALPAAASVELLHNFSLVHDDIQDSSPLRHNRPTVWMQWGVPTAINVGDAMFTLAYRALEGLLRMPSIKPQQVLEAWSIFNQTSLELTRGQHLDMRFEHETDVTTDDYLSMISGKSAALIAASAQLGALTGNRDPARAHHYYTFGLNTGIAFQIRDDILGIWGEASKTGKSTATDILSRKKSLPVLFGLQHSVQLQDTYGKEELTDEDVAEAVAELARVGAQEYAQQLETEYYERALKALREADPQGEAASWLDLLLESLFHRQY